MSLCSTVFPLASPEPRAAVRVESHPGRTLFQWIRRRARAPGAAHAFFELV